MKKTGKLTILITIIFICLSLFLFYGYIEDENKEYEIIFRKVYGDINIKNNTENRMSMAIIVRNHNSDFQEYMLGEMNTGFSFNSEKILIQEFSIVKSLTYKNNAYYYINLNIIPSDNFNYMDQIKVDTINIGNNKHYIGALSFNFVGSNDIENGLKIKSAKAMSIGMGLSDYFSTIENVSSEPIIITTIDVGQFKELITGISFSDFNKLSVDKENNFTIESHEVTEFRVNFNKNSDLAFDVYYFSPIIQYTNSKGYNNLNFDYFAAGLSITNDEFKNIIKSFD